MCPDNFSHDKTKFSFATTACGLQEKLLSQEQTP